MKQNWKIQRKRKCLSQNQNAMFWNYFNAQLVKNCQPISFSFEKNGKVTFIHSQSLIF